MFWGQNQMMNRFYLHFTSNMFKMVDWMKIGDKIQQINPLVIKSEICWLVLMAFSTTVVTADDHPQIVQNYLDEQV